MLQAAGYLESLPRHQGVLLVLNQDDEPPTELLLQERVDGIAVLELLEIGATFKRQALTDQQPA